MKLTRIQIATWVNLAWVCAFNLAWNVGGGRFLTRHLGGWAETVHLVGLLGGTLPLLVLVMWQSRAMLRRWRDE